MDYNNDNMGSAFSQYATEPQYGYTDVLESQKNRVLTNIFMWMFAGLGLSAIAALVSFKFMANLVLNPIIYIVP